MASLCRTRETASGAHHTRARRKVGAFTFDFAKIRLLGPQALTGGSVQQFGDEVFGFLAHLGRKMKLAF